MERLSMFLRACILFYLINFSSPSVSSNKTVLLPPQIAHIQHKINRTVHHNNKTIIVPHDHIGTNKKLIEHKNKSVSMSHVPIVISSTSNPPHHNNVSQINKEGMLYNTNNFPRINSGALLRGFYVFVGLSIIVVMYLVVRSIRLRRKVSRVHKYGILANREDVEMTPLGEEDEDDDTIVFDLSNHHPT